MEVDEVSDSHLTDDFPNSDVYPLCNCISRDARHIFNPRNGHPRVNLLPCCAFFLKKIIKAPIEQTTLGQPNEQSPHFRARCLPTYDHILLGVGVCRDNTRIAVV